MTDERAVSAVLGYILTLSVVTLLVSGLFVASGDFVQNQHERAIRAELEVVGNRLAADLAAVDRLALATGAGGRTRLATDLPARVAGNPYRIDVSPVNGSPNVYQLDLTTTEPAVSVVVRVRLETDLAGGTLNGGDVTVVYDGTAMEVRDG